MFKVNYPYQCRWCCFIYLYKSIGLGRSALTCLGLSDTLYLLTNNLSFYKIIFKKIQCATFSGTSMREVTSLAPVAQGTRPYELMARFYCYGDHERYENTLYNRCFCMAFERFCKLPNFNFSHGINHLI